MERTRTPDIQKALDRFKLGVDADIDQRKREVDALRFQVPELSWPNDVREQRKPQLVGGVAIPQRPMLSIPTLDHPIQLTINAEKAAHLGIGIHPLSDNADDDTAEVLQGLYRRIEVASLQSGIPRVTMPSISALSLNASCNRPAWSWIRSRRNPISPMGHGRLLRTICRGIPINVGIPRAAWPRLVKMNSRP